MLVSFTVSNFKSILDPVTLTMAADADDDTYKEALIKTDDGYFNPVSVIYGPNGSGKTSIYRAFMQMKKLILHGVPCYSYNKSKDKNGLCHRSSESADVNMEAVFIQSGIMYRVTVCLAPDGMTGDLELIGERGTETVASYDRKLKILSGGFVPKEGYGPEHVKNLTDFFRLISVFDSIENMVEKTHVFSKDEGLAMLEEQGELDQGAWFIDNDNGQIQSMLFTKLLMAFGTGIEAVEFKLCEGKYQNVTVPEIMVYKDFEIPIKEESSGTRRLIRIAFILSHVLLYGGQVVMIDELDAGLHDVMLTEIVKNFLKYNNRLSPEKRSQFIFSTHNTCLMGSKLLRKDQIWFTEMKDHHHTELYSLSDLKDSPRPTADFAMQYLEGRYGALPEVPEWKEEAEEEGDDEPL